MVQFWGNFIIFLNEKLLNPSFHKNCLKIFKETTLSNCGISVNRKQITLPNYNFIKLYLYENLISSRWLMWFLMLFDALQLNLSAKVSHSTIFFSAFKHWNNELLKYVYGFNVISLTVLLSNQEMVLFSWLMDYFMSNNSNCNSSSVFK